MGRLLRRLLGLWTMSASLRVTGATPGRGQGGPAVSYLQAVQLDKGQLSLSRAVGTHQHQVAPSSKAQCCVQLWELEGDCWAWAGRRGLPCNDTQATVSHSH